LIRVGLYRTTDNTLPVRSLSGSLLVQQNGNTICTLAQGEIATVVYDRIAKIYTVSGPNCSSQSAGWFVLAAADGVAPLEITDYSRPVSWLPGANDNKFRSKLELRYAPATDAVWVINELLIETYLKGIAETSNVSPMEYQKALLTAARTYALYHVNRGTKHAAEFFLVDAHLDQVYRGYGQEARSPNIVDGVIKTRGQIVTYDGKLAITPYFSTSDGRTRDWTEVWGGKGYAWLKSVPVPHDVGQALWGHGVGMSARGALYMASKDKALYDAILKHFYVGIELRQAYK
jgi:peptidoglycan hydrolase-like amidase